MAPGLPGASQSFPQLDGLPGELSPAAFSHWRVEGKAAGAQAGVP